MSGDDLEFRKFERDVIEIRDWPAGFRRTKRPRVFRLEDRKERRARYTRNTAGSSGDHRAANPTAKDDAQRFKSEIANASPKLPHRIHRAEQINRGYPDKPVRSLSHAFRDRII